MILVTGGTGFVGAPAVEALARLGAPLRLLVHRRPTLIRTDGRLELADADLTDAASLHGVCRDVDTLVHLAADVGEDEARCRAVNLQGTRHILREAEQAGVRRIVYLSTAAVYGRGVHRGIAENAVEPRPVSAASRTRLAAEHLVRAAGGTVLRPMFVYGPGDTWFVPTLLGAVQRLGAVVDGGRALLSLVAVDDLARAIAALATGVLPPRPGTVLHAVHPEPVTAAELLATAAVRLGVPMPARDLTPEEARSRLGADPRVARQLELVTSDHYYAGERLWRLTGVRPTGFAEAFAGYADWYRTTLAQARGARP